VSGIDAARRGLDQRVPDIPSWGPPSILGSSCPPQSMSN
jgi:hypothetical protein